MRLLIALATVALTACAHAQYLTKPRAEQVFVKTNMLQIIKSNDLQGALICIDTNLVNLYSNLLTAAEIGNIVTSNINENVQTLVYGALGDFLTNYPHTYADSSGYQNFYATTTRTDAAINRDLRVDRDAAIGRNLTVAGTITSTGNMTAQKDLAVATNLTVGGTAVISGNVTASTNLTVGQSALIASNLAVAGNITVAGTVSIASTNAMTFLGPVIVGDATRSTSVKPSVIVQLSSADSSNSTVAADLGNTNTFASGVSARFLESKWGTIRGALDGAPAEVYPSWRLVYVGSSVGTNTWGASVVTLSAAAGQYSMATNEANSWVVPGSASWTNIYQPAGFGVTGGLGFVSLAVPGLYRISSSFSATNCGNGNSSGSAHGFAYGFWTNSTKFKTMANSVFQYEPDADGNESLDLGGARVLAVAAPTSLRFGGRARGLVTGSARVFRFCPTSCRVVVEWMPLPSTLLGGVSPSAYDFPVPATQFNEANAFNILQ
jgi:hypothetical protein